MYNFFLGIITAIIYSILLLPKNVGVSPKINPTIYPILYSGMIIIPFGEYAIHIHHWIISFFFSIYFMYKNNYLLGFFLGLLLQGLTYSDSYKIICKNPY